MVSEVLTIKAKRKVLKAAAVIWQELSVSGLNFYSELTLSYFGYDYDCYNELFSRTVKAAKRICEAAGYEVSKKP